MTNILPTMPAAQALAALWSAAGLPAEALGQGDLPSAGPVLPSSFAVTTAAQASLAAAGLASALLAAQRGAPPLRVRVDATPVAMACLAWFTLDGQVPDLWDPLSGLYRTGDGWVRVHANFAHHRDGALRLLGLPPGPGTPREAVSRALARWRALDFEAAAAEAGLVVAAARSHAEWQAHPQAAVLMRQPVVSLRRIGEAPPRPLPRWQPGQAPLAGLRVLELARILAGPVAGRTLALHGADVLLVSAPHLPHIAALPDTSRGKRSTWLDLRTRLDAGTLHALAREADVFLQAYRPGALEARGFGAQALAEHAPGIVCASLSAYGTEGPWGARRGFDSLVQTATGLNADEAAAFGSDTPRALPLQILDYAAGHLLAFGAQAARWRQACEGGSWHVQVSLAGVAAWLRTLGREGEAGLAAERPALQPWLDEQDSGFGRLGFVRHPVHFDGVTPRPAVRPGTHPARW